MNTHSCLQGLFQDRRDSGQVLLLEEGAGSVGLDHGAALLAHPAGQGEPDLGVVHLGDQGPPALAGSHHLAPDDLDGVGPGEEGSDG